MQWQQKAVLTFIILLTLNISHSSPAAVIQVPADYSTIQAAIDAASDGDQIIVLPGYLQGNINIAPKRVIILKDYACIKSHNFYLDFIGIKKIDRYSKISSYEITEHVTFQEKKG